VDLIILRHARPVSEVRPAGQGTADPPLAPIGIEQAAATAEHLANWNIDHVVSSTMRRAVETAQPLADRLGIVSGERIRGELFRLLEVEDPTAGFSLLEEIDLLWRVLPEFAGFFHIQAAA